MSQIHPAPLVMSSACYLTAQQAARKLGYELMTRIVTTPIAALAAKVLPADAERIAFTLRKATLVPRPIAATGGPFSFAPQPGDARRERSFATLAEAEAWLAQLAASPEAVHRQPVTGFAAESECTSVLFVGAGDQAAPLASKRRRRRRGSTRRIVDGRIAAEQRL